MQTYGFSVNTPLVNSLDGGQTPIPNLIDNPFPQGIQTPAGASQGASTFLGRAFNYVNTDFKLPYVNQFSFGLQYELPWRSKVEASYVGSRTRNMQTSRSVNTYDAQFRQSCNLAEGGNPLYCDQQLPNPFRGLEPFRGTGLFTSNTLSRATLAQQYPHFGTINELMRNDGAIWYNSLQITYETRSQHGLHTLASYTFSKMMEANGFDDLQRGVLQRSLYTWDRPHRFSQASIYELPFGPGKRFLNTAHPILKRIVGGWENSGMFTYQSGRPWDLPANLIYVKNAKVDDIDWQSPRVYVALLVDLFATADPEKTPGGSDMTIGEFLKKVEGAVVANRGTDLAVQAQLRRMLGNVTRRGAAMHGRGSISRPRWINRAACMARCILRLPRPSTILPASRLIRGPRHRIETDSAVPGRSSGLVRREARGGRAEYAGSLQAARCARTETGVTGKGSCNTA